MTIEEWRRVRDLLGERRHELGKAAGRLYPDLPRVGAGSLLCRPEWLPAAPLPLRTVELTWQDDPPPPAVTGAEPASEGVRPVRPDGRRFRTYAEALGELAPPAVFDNRPCYGLLGADLRGPRPGLRMGRAWYFDGIDVGEAVAHELAAGLGTPLRDLVGDPLDFGRRPARPAITTLTLRRAGGDAGFVLHRRDPAKVAHAGGLLQVAPVGVFQPLSQAGERDDFDLWRCMVREFSEELLGGAEEYDLPFEQWDFATGLGAAREAGRLQVYVLGLGVDPLSLAVDLLTVAVFDADLFDETFHGLVGVNAEGQIIGNVPFQRDVIAPFIHGTEPMQPAGAAVLDLAWRHRHHLLTRP
ncbi:hypothetical protein ACRYCC_03955 [Actinomadura scrupuli]|uniref:hypothetical protein n=1 Tax=Actinomadura scrupuli TaxID=559629 RepID=UPI003D96A03B